MKVLSINGNHLSRATNISDMEIKEGDNLTCLHDENSISDWVVCSPTNGKPNGFDVRREQGFNLYLQIK